MNNMGKIENEIVSVILKDKKNWVDFYLLLKHVEINALWKDLGLNSFTAWIKDFCVRNNINETKIWNTKKAGKVYEEYEERQLKKGIKIQSINQIGVSAESLVLLEKISKKAPQIVDKLIEKTINKELSRDDLREVYKSIRDSKDDETKNIISTAEIVACLSDEKWLGIEKRVNYFKSSFEQSKYKSISEFPIYNTDKVEEKLDLLVIENLTIDTGVNLHGIGIKVSKSDLINSIKYNRYIEFVNYTWLAVPKSLVDVATKYSIKECGIIAIEGNKAEIIKPSERLNPLMVQKTLTSLVLKLLK